MVFCASVRQHEGRRLRLQRSRTERTAQGQFDSSSTGAPENWCLTWSMAKIPMSPASIRSMRPRFTTSLAPPFNFLIDVARNTRAEFRQDSLFSSSNSRLAIFFKKALAPFCIVTIRWDARRTPSRTLAASFGSSTFFGFRCEMLFLKIVGFPFSRMLTYTFFSSDHAKNGYDHGVDTMPEIILTWAICTRRAGKLYSSFSAVSKQASKQVRSVFLRKEKRPRYPRATEVHLT